MLRYALIVALAATPVLADPWAGVDPKVQAWFQGLRQPDEPSVSCCGLADAYEADRFEVEGDHYVAIVTGQRVATNVPIGARVPVPNRKMKWDAGNPTGHGIIFLGPKAEVFCYVTPGGT